MPLLARQINNIGNRRIQSSSPFSELIIRWSKVRILADPSLQLNECGSAFVSLRYAKAPSEKGFEALNPFGL